MSKPRTYPLDVTSLSDGDSTTLMSKGHHDPAAFLEACELWIDGPIKGWGKVRHGWGRTVPERTGNYAFMVHAAAPHARGAYPTTTIVDDPAYDHEASESATTSIAPHAAPARAGGQNA